jgi:hypothetical protein
LSLCESVIQVIGSIGDHPDVHRSRCVFVCHRSRFFCCREVSIAQNMFRFVQLRKLRWTL